MKVYPFLLLATLPLLSSCSRYYLSCDQQTRNLDYLASSFVKSPDPRATDASKGEQLVVAWHIPESFIDKATCELMMTFWDYSQKNIDFTLHERLGQYRFENLGDEFKKNQGLIAYKAVLKDPDGNVYREWEHQLYTPLIHISEEEGEMKEDPMLIEGDEVLDWDTSL